jgi:uncharacterized protein (DUF608 family)
MVVNVLKLVLIIIGIISIKVMSLPETGGIPVGGMGTGYVKYNARSGEFAASGKIPPAASDQENEFINKKSISSGFHFSANGKSVIKARTNNEDARFPLYTAHFLDTLSEVTFSLKAFCPFVPGNNPLYYQLATSPLAFFEITAKNNGAGPAEVAVAMEFTNRSTSQNLLGGADTGSIEQQDSCIAISFSGDTLSGNAYLMLNCDSNSPVYSAGVKDSFSSVGKLISTTGRGNCVAAKCIIPRDGTVHFKFTLAWWRSFVSNTDRYGTGKVDEDNYYYHNFYTSSKQAALFGAQHFNLINNGITTIVDRVTGSNFPDWYKERLLNNLYPMVNNAVCTKDGRTAFWEGQYPVIGSIDQSQHAALWYTFNWPQNQWHELQYWMRTAHTGKKEDSTLIGQVHHDFNSSPENFTYESHFLCPWDDYQHSDYWYRPNTTDWTDLNIMAILKLYELTLATGCRESLMVYYPKILKTAERLLRQCTETQTKLPLSSRSTYDSEGFDVPQYASGISLVAFLAMEDMAKIYGDTVNARKYRQWYIDARAEFKTLLFRADFCNRKNFSEGDIAGYSWGNYFSLEPIMDADVITTGCQRLWNVYMKGSKPSIEDWHFYTCDHWGGAEIARGMPDTAMVLFKMDYDYFHNSNKSFVFWQSLWNTIRRYDSYVTAPSVWRSYFQMTGYMIDNANKRLWIRPKIPSLMNGEITNAPLLNPGGWGMLNYKESVDQSGVNQNIRVTFDSLVTFNELIFKKINGTESPVVKINNISSDSGNFTVKTEDWGIEKNIRVSFATPISIDKNGITVQISSQKSGIHLSDRKSQKASISIISQSLQPGKPVRFSVDKPGNVTIELLSLNGTKIGSLFNQFVSTSGTHSFLWNGVAGKNSTMATQIMILRLNSLSGSVSKQIISFGY